MRRATLPACALGTIVLLSGCVYVTPTITEEEATQKIQEHTENTLTALPQETELEPLSEPSASPCNDTSPMGAQKRVSVGENFWINGIPEEDNDTALDLMHNHWTNNGYQILNDNRPEGTFINARNEEDDFLVATRYNENGTLSLTVGSPCLWPDGNPELF